MCSPNFVAGVSASCISFSPFLCAEALIGEEGQRRNEKGQSGIKKKIIFKCIELHQPPAVKVMWPAALKLNKQDK